MSGRKKKSGLPAPDEKLKPKRTPKPRPDGVCARRECDRKVDIKVNPALPDSARAMTVDPFCSTQCAKIFWGIMTIEEASKSDKWREA